LNGEVAECGSVTHCEGIDKLLKSFYQMKLNERAERSQRAEELKIHQQRTGTVHH
jgi:hypothetical protein